MHLAEEDVAVEGAVLVAVAFAVVADIYLVPLQIDSVAHRNRMMMIVVVAVVVAAAVAVVA